MPCNLPPTTTEIDQCMNALIDTRKGGANAFPQLLLSWCQSKHSFIGLSQWSLVASCKALAPPFLMSIKAFIHWSISVVVGGKLQGINSSFPCVNQNIHS
jgi:hypothetical protein